jgi:hypothetical protein
MTSNFRVFITTIDGTIVHLGVPNILDALTIIKDSYSLAKEQERIVSITIIHMPWLNEEQSMVDYGKSMSTALQVARNPSKLPPRDDPLYGRLVEIIEDTKPITEVGKVIGSELETNWHLVTELWSGDSLQGGPD